MERAGEERRKGGEKERNKKRSKICGETRRERESVTGWTEQTRQDETDRETTGQDREPTGQCQMPNQTRVQYFCQMNSGACPAIRLHHPPLAFLSQPFFTNSGTTKKKRKKEERNKGKEETCIIFIRDDWQ